MAFVEARWIWNHPFEREDSYATFYDSFVYQNSDGRVEVRLSVDSDYVLWINGSYVASGQYGDFEHYKIYDTVEITAHLCEGKNTFRVLAYHCGVPTSRYRPAPAGLLYEVVAESSGVLLFSRAGVPSDNAPAYQSGMKKRVSNQLGFSFCYDAEKGAAEMTPAVEVEKHCELYPRPIPKARVLDRREARLLKNDGNTHFLIDLGGEVVGFPTLELSSEVAQAITVAWGEHLEDGCVRQRIGDRDFSFEYCAVRGKNCYTNYMLRLGCRYLEVFCRFPIELSYVGVLPEVYEAEERAAWIDAELDRRIYALSVNTLHLCMMEHYVDCPWREQALYAFDSRNQMLFGYDAFVGGNAAYARANLQLIGMDRREDGLLSICYPCGGKLAIPSFSLWYVIAMWEYLEHTGDTTLAETLFDKLASILAVFAEQTHDGLVSAFSGEQYWNFYDWSPFSEGRLGKCDEAIPDLMINCLFILALSAFEKLCCAIGRENPYQGAAERLRVAARAYFLTEEGFYTMHAGARQYTVLGHSLAILAGLCRGEEAQKVCQRIVSGAWADCSLSTKLLEYDALLMTDADAYAPFILREVRLHYQKMLDAGSDTAWETTDGAAAFAGAGSLCHGWSAVPVYIFRRLGIVRYEIKGESNYEKQKKL